MIFLEAKIANFSQIALNLWEELPHVRQAVGRNVIFFGYKLQLFLDRDAPLHENVSKHDQLLMPF